ncbi:Mfa1 fimbrilin C-terminal domain-containing protein [Parabacteroides johnsonii]|uniref:Mfa1 fimbrilin C-terminal domain-containing protein n=1 Tax=Parabacteroides johnsonii TaxID=387661 RepID=UPI0011DCF691|nr:Mfa1 fimbrilin C-terminal domain-containing protein [Parabacteroides johnsonii]MBP3641583.1 Mfa1 fimbrilin C-terminal domain-containing protein [Parabacteroides sp.]
MFLNHKDLNVSYNDFDDATDKDLGTNILKIKDVKDPFGYIEAMAIEAEKGQGAAFQTPESYLDAVTNWNADRKKELYKEVKTYTDGVCYYPYWIRHADNGKPTVMDVMEFGIVRNNIYDMEVTGINKLGLSEVDVPNPTGPDEDPNVRISVNIHVKNWVVCNNGGILL